MAATLRDTLIRSPRGIPANRWPPRHWRGEFNGPVRSAAASEWANILEAVEAARDATDHGIKSAVVVLLPNDQAWSFRLVPMSEAIDPGTSLQNQ
jgi:hypothetical protein